MTVSRTFRSAYAALSATSGGYSADESMWHIVALAAQDTILLLFYLADGPVQQPVYLINSN